MSAVRPLPASPAAHRIRDDAEALAVAKEVAAQLAPGAASRDRERRLPHAEMDLLSQSGLLAVTVPRAYGGAEVRAGTLARIVATLAAADGSIGQIPQNHFFMLEGLRLEGTEAQKRFFYARVLAGERFGNALSERGTKTAHDIETTIRPDGNGGWLLDGTKFYSTGALFADWIVAVARRPEDDQAVIAFVPKGAKGLAVADDWSGFGQRTTGSGTTRFEAVAVEAGHVVPYSALFARPTPMGPHAQVMHAAIQQGIAEGALAETIRFVTEEARPWKESGAARQADDPHVVASVGETKIRVDAARALLARAGRFVDRATAGPDENTVAEASVAVAEAKIAATEAALLASTRLIELGGARATLAEHGFDRFWRNARTHSVHDPVLWKYRFVGDYWLNGNRPPRHGAI